MKNVESACISLTKDSQIKFEENKRKIIFQNPSRRSYKKVKVDGCAIKTGLKCDDLLVSQDEYEERYVELKGIDVMHAIDQLEQTILKIGEFDNNRHAYVICTMKYQRQMNEFANGTVLNWNAFSKSRHRTSKICLQKENGSKLLMK